MEAELGPGTTVMFLQGGSGDVNPLVQGVRARLRNGHPVIAIGDISVYYGQAGDPARWNIGDRGGGTFEEVAELGEAFSEEALYVARHIRTIEPTAPAWSAQVTIEAMADPGESTFQPPPLSMALITEKPTAVTEVFQRHARRSRLGIRFQGPHCLRHSLAVQLLRQGVSLKAIGDVLGHRTLESTCLYLQLATEDLRDVALLQSAAGN